MMKRIRMFTLVFALMLTLPFTGILGQDTIQVSLPDASGKIGESVMIPVTTEDLTGQNVTSFGFSVVYDADVVDITGVDDNGTLSEGMSFSVNPDVADTIRISAASATAIQGSGTLVNLTADYVGTGTSDIELINFQFNEGTPADTTLNGSVTVNPLEASLPDISGAIGLSESVDVTIDDVSGLNVTAFSFTISYNSDVIEITGVDQAGTLSEGMTVDDNPDVSGEISVSGASATPISGSGALISLNVNYVGVGTTNLTWSAFELNEGDPPATTLDGSATVSGVPVTLPEMAGGVNRSGMIPVTVGDVSGLNVTAYEFTVTYDEDVLDITGTEIEGTLSEGMTVDANPNVAGQITVGAASAEALSGSGVLIYLNADFLSLGSSALTFDNFTFNEGDPAEATQNGMVEVQNPPTAFQTVNPADGDTVMVDSQDEGLMLQWTRSTDPDGESVSYEAVLVGPDTSFATSDTMVSLTEDYLNTLLGEEQHAMINWYVEASDGDVTTMTDTASFTLEKMLAPSTFATVQPKAEDLLIRSVDEEFTAMWEMADDPNMDEVSYTMKFVGSDSTLDAGQDTSLTITGQQLVDLFIVEGLSRATVNWYVEASDGNLVTVSDTASFVIYDVSSPITIEAARIDANGDYVPDKIGQYVRVTGVVTTPNYSEGGTDYYMQDNTTGINVFTFDFDAGLDVGDEVSVVGEIDQYNGKTEILPVSESDVTVLSEGNDVTPVEVGLNGINENNEGRLVTVTNIDVLVGDWPADGDNANLPVTGAGSPPDTAIMRIDKETDIDGSAAPDSGRYNVTGVIDQFDTDEPYDSGYQLRPRFRSDFELIPGTPVAPINELPDEFALNQNYPNPFNPTTTIKFQLPEQSDVSITVYNMAGQQVTSLVNTSMDAGYHQVTWNGTNDAGVQMSSGMYIYRIRADEFTESRKMILMR